MPGPQRTGAEAFLATHLDLAAAFGWNVRQQNMNALNSHDTARAATVMIDGGQRLGAVVMFTLPGVPVVFAGDEFGLKGHNGEASRTPMPWNAPEWVLEDLRDDYAALAALRRDQPALTGGGIRWVHAHGDALAFVRETAESSVLVVVTRAAADVRLAPGSLSASQLRALAADPAFSNGQIRADGTAPEALICTRGPAAGVWGLPGPHCREPRHKRRRNPGVRSRALD